MFLGYQNGKIAFVAETREELKNIPYVVLDKIEETDKECVKINGEYKFKEECYNEFVIQKRKEEYPSIEEQLDMIYHDLQDGTDNWKTLIQSIKEKYPKEKREE